MNKLFAFVAFAVLTLTFAGAVWADASAAPVLDAPTVSEAPAADAGFELFAAENKLDSQNTICLRRLNLCLAGCGTNTTCQNSCRDQLIICLGG